RSSAAARTPSSSTRCRCTASSRSTSCSSERRARVTAARTPDRRGAGRWWRIRRAVRITRAKGGRVRSAPLRRLEAIAQRLELLAQRARHAIAEAVVELLREVGLGEPAVGVDREERLEVVARHLDAVEVERALGGHAPDGRLDRVGGSVEAAGDPLDHARVLAEARPQEAAVVAL